MSKLSENLKAIIEEKNTKLLPENIRYGMTILGVTGTLLQAPITLTENIIQEDETATVKTKYLRVDLEEVNFEENQLTTSYLPLHLDVMLLKIVQLI